MMIQRGFRAFGMVVLIVAGGSVSAVAVESLPGPMDVLGDLQDVGKIAFKMADLNNDGLISQKEAIDAANLMVGGFFFRADANGDGTLSQQEAQQARDSFLSQKPWLRFVFQRAKTAPISAPAQPGQPLASTDDISQTIERLLDTNNDKQLQATEVRQAVQTLVQGLYAASDTNRDGQLSPTEINSAMIGAVRSASQAMFQAADQDQNGQLSRAEYDKAILVPADTLFAILDANNDGQLSPQELQSAENVAISQFRALRVPEPANSARNLIQSGRRPEQVAPVPNFGTPGQLGTTPAPTPAPAPVPGQPAAPGATTAPGGVR